MTRRTLEALALVVVAGVCTALVLIPELPAPVRVPAGALLAVLAGYALSRALFASVTVGAAERILLTAGLAVAIPILGALVFQPLGIPMGVPAWALLFEGVTLAGAAAVFLRLSDKPRPRRSVLHVRGRDAIALGLALVITAGAVVLGTKPLPAPADVQGYSAVWLTPLRDGGPEEMQLGVASSELERKRFRLTLDLDGRRARTWERIELVPGDRWTVIMRPGADGRAHEVTARLYRADDPKVVYRQVRATAPAAATR